MPGVESRASAFQRVWPTRIRPRSTTAAVEFLLTDLQKEEVLNLIAPVTSSFFTAQRKSTLNTKTEQFTWIGLLRYKQDNHKREAITGIVLIGRGLAIGNAYDVARIDPTSLRATTAAMFYKEDSVPWFSDVTEYILHPEFENNVLNTIAIIKLALKHTFQLKPIEWPLHQSNYYNSASVMGFTDRRRKFEKFTHTMDSVDKTECINFYNKEELNSKILWPSSYQCYRSKFNQEPCIFDPGMALVAYAGGKWILLGISVLGPGCALPSRYIEFFPYISWIKQKTEQNKSNLKLPNLRKTITQDQLDRSEVFGVWRIFKADPWTVSVRVDLLGKRRRILKKCDADDGAMLGREHSRLVLTEHTRGVAEYTLSIDEWMTAGYTCMTIHIDTVKRNASKLWYQKLFPEDWISNDTPVNYLFKTSKPRITVGDKRRNYDYANVLLLKCEFEEKGTLSISFFGNLVAHSSTTATTYINGMDDNNMIWRKLTPKVSSKGFKRKRKHKHKYLKNLMSLMYL